MARESTESSFDELASGLARGTLSRGKALRLLGGGLVGSALASLVPGAAWADDDCRGFGRRCRRDRQCCSRNCVRRGDDKVCGCPEGKTRCGGRCVSTGCPQGQIFDPASCACVAECVSNGGPCSGDGDCCTGICDTNSSTCAECQSGGGPCRRCCSFACTNDVCLPPSGGNLLECDCVDTAGNSAFCTEVACDPSGVHQLCVALCASRGGLVSERCTTGYPF